MCVFDKKEVNKYKREQSINTYRRYNNIYFANRLNAETDNSMTTVKPVKLGSCSSFNIMQQFPSVKITVGSLVTRI